MRTRSQTDAVHKTLLDLPPEIFTMLEAYLEIREIASCILTCRTIGQRVERFLYREVFVTPRSSNTNTSHLVAFLRRRPEVVHWVKKLVVREYDVVYFPQLLAFGFPNLTSLILQHEGPVALPSCGRRKINALNALVKPQPALRNLTFSIEQKVRTSPYDHELYYLPASTSPMFRHPKLVRARLSHLDFTMFDRLPGDYFRHTNLRELILERCRYSAKALQMFLNPCQKLNKLWLKESLQPLYAPSELPSILSPIKDTLRVLKSDWGHIAPLPEGNADFRDYVNLHSIIMHPKLLFGKSYMTLPKHELLRLIKSTLPPNLMILILEGIVPVNPHTSADMYNQWRQNFEDDFDRDPIPDHDLNLMRHLLTYKDDVAPQLRWLAVQHLERMQNIPQDIVDLAKRKNVKCCPLYMNDEIAPPLDMSKHVPGELWEDKERQDDEDTSGFCTMLDHTRGLTPWPEKPAGNL